MRVPGGDMYQPAEKHAQEFEIKQSTLKVLQFSVAINEACSSKLCCPGVLLEKSSAEVEIYL